MTAHGSGESAPGPSHLLRGRTRATNSWHVYTAIYDGDKSELYVDGIKEASGKAIGKGALDGLRLGCDHSATFYLRGAIAEVRIFSCHLSPTPRAQLEAAMALRYGLHTAGTRAPTSRALSRRRAVAPLPSLPAAHLPSEGFSQRHPPGHHCTRRCRASIPAALASRRLCLRLRRL